MPAGIELQGFRIPIDADGGYAFRYNRANQPTSKTNVSDKHFSRARGVLAEEGLSLLP